jgi:small-conductance mechanosensitive channel
MSVDELEKALLETLTSPHSEAKTSNAPLGLKAQLEILVKRTTTQLAALKLAREIKVTAETARVAAEAAKAQAKSPEEIKKANEDLNKITEDLKKATDDVERIENGLRNALKVKRELDKQMAKPAPQSSLE